MTQQTRDVERSPDERDGAQEGVKGDTCPECQGQITEEGGQGEATCESCGLVYEEDQIDYGPEWRAFTSDERDERSRVGSPTTQLMHDKGLSTTIGWQNKDAKGRDLSPRKRAQLQRLRTWDERFRAKDAHEENLKHALGEINRMTSALGLPDSVRETGAVIYRRAVKENLLPGRSIEGMATASLYVAARKQGIPRSQSEFVGVSRVKETRIQRAYRYLSRELGLEIEPEDPMQYIPKFVSSLAVSDEVEELSRELIEVMTQNSMHSGKSPAGLAAAAVYASAYLTNEQLTQEAVSNTANVCKLTIRNRYQEILEVYEKHG